MVVQVEIPYVHAHLSWFDVWDGAVYMEFHGGQVWCWCDEIYWIIYQIPSCSDSCSLVSVFCGGISHTALTYVALLSFGLYLWNINLILSVPVCAFQPWHRRPSSLHMEFVHTGGSLFTKCLYPRIFPVVSQVIWCATGYTVIVYFWGIF